MKINTLLQVHRSIQNISTNDLLEIKNWKNKAPRGVYAGALTGIYGQNYSDRNVLGMFKDWISSLVKSGYSDRMKLIAVVCYSILELKELPR